MSLFTLGSLRSALAALLLALFLPASSWSQTVRGVVTDAMTNQPLSGVTVQLITADGVELVVAGNTTASGKVVLQAPVRGNYWFDARLLGYSPGYSRVEFGDSEEVSIEVALTPLSMLLDTVYVRATVAEGQREFESRRHLKWNFSYDWSEFKDLGAHTVREVIDYGSLGVGRCAIPDVYLDGVKSLTFGLDVPLDWVYGVEIYRTYYDIPLKYRDPFANKKCGGVLIWTRPIGQARPR